MCLTPKENVTILGTIDLVRFALPVLADFPWTMVPKSIQYSKVLQSCLDLLCLCNLLQPVWNLGGGLPFSLILKACGVLVSDNPLQCSSEVNLGIRIQRFGINSLELLLLYIQPPGASLPQLVARKPGL